MEDVGQHISWGWEIAVYLFLGGLAAGTLCAVAIINLVTGERFKNTIRFGAWFGAIALAVGVSFLLLESGVPFRALILYQSFVNFNSWMALGAWLLLIGIFIYAVYALSCTDWVTRKVRPLLKIRTVLAIIVVPLSVSIAAYTGVLLSVLWARPFWNTWFLPALFTVSAFDTGVALVTAYATLREFKEGVARLKRILEASIVILVALEGTILGFYLGTMLSSDSEAAVLSAQVLTEGSQSQYFWFIVIGLGLAIPFLASILLLIRSNLAQKTKYILPVVGVLSCLAGGFTLRLVILAAGLPIYT